MGYYTYTIYFVDGHYYHGSHKYSGGDPLTDGYFGSPVTHREKWLTTMYWKEVTGMFGSQKEVSFAEQENIRPVFRTDPFCLNTNCGGLISPERALAGSLKGGKTTGTRCKMNKTGICDPANQEKGRVTARKRSVGFFDANFQQSEQMKKMRQLSGEKSGKIAVESGQLAKAREKIDPEKRREACRQTALKLHAEGKGLGSIPFEERSQRAKDVVKKTNASKWVDPDHPELGAHNPGNLVKLQRKMGYPSGKENKVRLG